MPRRSNRFSRDAPWLLCVSLIGALAGAMLVQPRAGACDCGVPSWRLTLQADADDAGAAPQDWPSVARLEARPGTILLWTEEDFALDTVDYLHAGEP